MKSSGPKKSVFDWFNHFKKPLSSGLSAGYSRHHLVHSGNSL